MDTHHQTRDEISIHVIVCSGSGFHFSYRQSRGQYYSVMSRAAGSKIGYTSPLGLLRHHEFEYFTMCVSFLQGLFHWLAAVGLEIIIPKPNAGLGSKRMNSCLATCLMTLSFWILAFYNNHLTFYGDYFGMIKRLLHLFAKRFLWNCPPRLMAFFYVPTFVM